MTIHVLLIEDNEQNRYLATFMMERSGCSVTHAADGREALARARARQFDLILLDIQLPGMDGYAVARALRAEDLQAGVPIVAVTSYAMSGDRDKALAAGCDGYIEKPIDSDTFMADIRRHLRGGAQGRTA